MTIRPLFLNKYASIVCAASIALTALHCTVKKPILKSGIWQAAIERPDGQQIVFNFETKDSAGKTVLYVMNGSERLFVDSIVLKDDSVFIELPFFESGFRTKLIAGNILQGTWIKNFGSIVQILPFSAKLNEPQRFLATAPPAANITGRWSAGFVGKNNKLSTLVGEFNQQGAHLTGTFLDPTGDYRYLEGIVNGDSLKLSGFDGGHAFLFTAKIDNGSNITSGKFYSGASGVQNWSATKNDTATILDGYSATTLNAAAGKLNFSFPDVQTGKNVSIADKKYAGKVVVLQILGSWCPNCMDETEFLSDYYRKNQQKGVEIIGLAYERTTDFKSSQKSLQPFQKRFTIQYPVLVTGVAVSDSLRAQKTLPQLGKIAAFPTTIFINKKGEISKVHTGYNGPATGVHYEAYKKEFNELIEKLLAEK